MLMYVKSVDTKQTVMPEFTPRSWYRYDRIDARPLIWALLNSPESFQREGCYVRHIPSGHCFYTSFPEGYRASHYSCGCSGRKYQRFQWLAVGSAIRAWKRWDACRQMQANTLSKQFRGHFIPAQK